MDGEKVDQKIEAKLAAKKLDAKTGDNKKLASGKEAGLKSAISALRQARELVVGSIRSINFSASSPSRVANAQKLVRDIDGLTEDLEDDLRDFSDGGPG